MAKKAAWEPRYTLRKAAPKFWPDGSMTKRSLTRLIKKGKLRAEKVNNKFYVRERDVVAMHEAAAHNDKPVEIPDRCRDQRSPLDSTSGAPAMSTNPSGSFSTERKKLAQAQAQRTLERLKKPLPTTAPIDTNHRVVSLPPKRSSSMK
jgi:hypothetical protein